MLQNQAPSRMNYWGICSELLLPSEEVVLSRRPEVRRRVMAISVTTCARKWVSHLMGDGGKRMPVGGCSAVFRRGLPNGMQRFHLHLPCCRCSLCLFLCYFVKAFQLPSHSAPSPAPPLLGCLSSPLILLFNFTPPEVMTTSKSFLGGSVSLSIK